MRRLAALVLVAPAIAVAAPDGGPGADAVAPAPLAAPSTAVDAGAGDDADGGEAGGVPEAQPISFKAVLEKTEVTIGDPFHLNIEVRHEAKEKWSLPVHLDLGDFGLREHKEDETGQEPKVTIFHLTLQAFAVGERTIPAISLDVDTPDGPRRFEVPPQTIKVLGVIDDSQGPPQMKEDGRPLPTMHHWVLWRLWLALLLVGGVMAALWYRERQSRPATRPPPKPRLPAFEEAMLRLVDLEEQNLVARGERQAFYFRLSEIIRDFLGRRYGFDSLEMTSDELLLALRQRPTPGLDYDGLTAFLHQSDLVKFAKSEPTDGQCKGALDSSRELLLRARPIIQSVAAVAEPERRPA